MIPTLKDKILETDPLILQAKVKKLLQFYWDEEAMKDLPRRFALLWEGIKDTQVHYQHNILVDFVAYHCFLGESKELTKQFSVYDEHILVEDFQEIPAWEIRLEPWEYGSGPLLEDLSHLDVVHLLISSKDMPALETRDLGELSKYLGARLPAYTQHRQEQWIAGFIAMVLDKYSGRIAMMPEPCETDRAFELKWRHLYSRISEYKALKKLREEILLSDI